MKRILSLPVILPFIALLHSRKFVAAVIAVVTQIIVTQVPSLALDANVLALVISAVAISLIFGIAHEDAAQIVPEAIATATLVPGYSLKDAVNEIKQDTAQAAINAIAQASQLPQPPATGS